MNARRRSSGLSALVVVLVVLVLLVGGIFFADRYAVRDVQRRAATQLQAELGTPQPPKVTIEHFPFLTQVAAQSFRTVHLVADQVGATNQSSVVIAHADLTLTDVVSQDRFATMTVSHAEGTALLDYSELQSLAAVPLTYVGDGRFEFESTTEVLSVPVKAKVTGGLALDAADQTVNLTDPKVEVAGVTLPDTASQALLKAIVKPIPVGGIPFGLRLTSIDAQDDGLHAGVSGDNIALSR